MCIRNWFTAGRIIVSITPCGHNVLRQTESEPRVPERNWTFGYQLNEA